mgnify:FL=1
MKTNLNEYIPVIDLFAGPGGLGEGFSSLSSFKVVLSIEKDLAAHRTLELRNFYRQFEKHNVPDEYYQYLSNNITREKLFSSFPAEAEAACAESWLAELGKTDEEIVDKRIELALNGADYWVLIGGPPCQAYSIAGRSRNGGINATDKRAYLYKEYLRIIAKHKPSVFVMENVKGLLSARSKGTNFFQKIIEDLSKPSRLNSNASLNDKYDYILFSLSESSVFSQKSISEGLPEDFIVRSENYGIPQARHRIFICGIQGNYKHIIPEVLQKQTPVSVRKVISDLPRVRGGLSKIKDSSLSWVKILTSLKSEDWMQTDSKEIDDKIKKIILKTIKLVKPPKYDRGSERIRYKTKSEYKREWFCDPNLDVVCNHSTRGHLVDDLKRYFFAACFALVKQKSPYLRDFPIKLLPNHSNVQKALQGSYFPDRFRVQLANKPASTITSHISKDGHYYIHYDPTQCRSLTVREAARLQTFPDNYFFEGPRTEQYKQIGNAVPPLLALQIAQIMRGLSKKLLEGHTM